MNPNKNIFKLYIKSSLVLRLFIALAVGAFLGLIFGEKINFLQPFGDLLIRLLKMIVAPLMFFSLLSGTAKISPKQLRNVGMKAILFFVISTVLASVLAICIGLILKPGNSVHLMDSHTVDIAKATQPQVIETLLKIVPLNIFASLSSDDILAYMFFAITVGISISILKNEDKKSNQYDSLIRFFDLIVNIINKIVSGILQYAPIGICALIAIAFGKYGLGVFASLGILFIGVYTSLLITIFFLAIILKGFQINIVKFFSGIKESMLTAFATRNASTTLPVAMRNIEENLGVHKSISSFVLPLGVNLYKIGTAIYQVLCVIFIMYATGQTLSIYQYLIVIIISLLSAMGTAAIAGGGAVALLILLNSIGFDAEQNFAVAAAYALIMGIDFILDMGRTCVNVTGQLACTAIVAKTEKDSI